MANLSSLHDGEHALPLLVPIFLGDGLLGDADRGFVMKTAAGGRLLELLAFVSHGELLLVADPGGGLGKVTTAVIAHITILLEELQDFKLEVEGALTGELRDAISSEGLSNEFTFVD